MKSNTNKSLDLRLWQACAGKIVGVPAANTTVFYFPQGHAENANCSDDYAATLGLPPLLLCRVQAVKLMADSDSDEVFAAITLLPLSAASAVGDDSDEECGGSDGSDKPGDWTSFAKVLTQSDANNGGGFSVPRHCADTVYPPLNYAADPPVQDLYARDVHGEVWKFRHIYRGTPRRHLLTSGWSVFVNKKRLVAKDSIVFLRADSGEICVGIRRARRSSAAGQGRSRVEEFSEAVRMAARGEAFEVVYYPRDGAAEFCVRASAVRAALAEQWCSGLRMKMEVEDEATSRIRACNGSVSTVKSIDPISWPNSPWRVLQVSWDDEPDKQQNPQRVSPWMVEAVSSMPIYPSFPSYAQPNKKLCLDHHHHHHPDLTLNGHFAVPAAILGNGPGPTADPLGYLRNSNPAGIQGARHLVFEVPLPELDVSNPLRPGMFPCDTAVVNKPSNGSLSCLFAVEQSSPNSEETSGGAKKRRFSLFGTVIEEQQQQERSPASDAKRDHLNGKSPSEDCVSDSDGSETAAEFGLDTGRCKVFKEFADIGWTIDLSVVGSYEELYKSLSKVFQIESSAMTTRVLYHDATGAPKQTGDQPFSDFMKKAKRLTIIADPELNNDIGRTG